MKAVPFPSSVVVYGTGMMGCSFALALRKQFPSIHVYGVDEPEVLESAQRLGAVEPGEPQAPDLFVLAAPVGAILQQLDNLPANTSTLIIDIGSTKAAICRKAESRKLPFVGGHPMTGSERSGPGAASADLFRNAPFFLCPISTTPPDAIAKMKPVLEGIGAQPVVLDPEQHDNLVAQLSHLPQILSTLLADQTAAGKALSGPGWKSMTRLAASPFHVWRDILQTSDPLPQQLHQFIARLSAVAAALESGKLEEIEAMFERANQTVAGETHE